MILHVNDVHGRTLGKVENGKSSGGYPRLSTAISRVREEVGAENVLVLHAGDEFSRGDAMTAATLGKANIAILNQIGLSAMTPGNGEFYSGAPNLEKRIAEARFPVLASNVRYRLDRRLLGQESQILRIGGVRIGILGQCFLQPEHPSSLPLQVESPADAARRLAPAVRQNADVVVCLNHIGLEEDRKLAATVSGIDLIVGGHSHTTLPQGHRVTGPDGKSVLIAQAGEYLRYLGRIDLQLERTGQSWRVASSSAELIPLDASIPEDPRIKAMIAQMWPATQPAKQLAPATGAAVGR